MKKYCIDNGNCALCSFAKSETKDCKGMPITTKDTHIQVRATSAIKNNLAELAKLKEISMANVIEELILKEYKIWEGQEW